MDAPDHFIAAALMHQTQPKHGSGDISKFITALQNGSTEDAKNKLKLLLRGKIGNYKLIFDNFVKEVPEEFKISKKKIYALWFHFVRKEKTMETADFIELFPEKDD